MTLLFLLVPILLALALIRLRTLNKRISVLEQRLSALEVLKPQERQHDKPGTDATGAPPDISAAADQTACESAEGVAPSAADTDTDTDATFDPWNTHPSTPPASTTPVNASGAASVHTPAPAAPATPRRINWMVWLGGICVGLAGILLVRYTIEMGLLGPAGKIILALITGVVLHLAAEWLRRHRQQSDVFGALAGGASITLYAALLATLHQFPDIPVELVFGGMALVSLITMFMALLHGPLLAALGMLGGYIVPIWVKSGTSVDPALIYALIITLAALYLLRYVWRLWLGVGVACGVALWWLISYVSPINIEFIRELYLFVVAWGILAMPSGDLLLKRYHATPLATWYAHIGARHDPAAIRLLAALTLVLIALGVNLLHSPLRVETSWSHLLIPLLLLYSAGRRPTLAPLPGLALLILSGALLGRHLHHSGLTLWIEKPDASAQSVVIALLVLLTLLHCGYGVRHLMKQRPFAGFWSVLTGFSPLLTLSVGYLLFTEFSTDWGWALTSLILGLIYLQRSIWLLRPDAPPNPPLRLLGITLLLAAHAAWSLAAVMWLREATLTLALALQLISLAYLHRTYPFPVIPWVIRILLLAIGVRLTLNPWLMSYPGDLHWTLWTYGGATACCFVASHISRDTALLQRWLQGAAATLLILTLNAEMRYWLYDGEVFSHRYGFKEALLNTLLWGGAGLVYHWRGRLSQQLQPVYGFLAGLLLSLAALNHLIFVLALYNPLWGSTAISATPLWNLMLPAYGAPVLLLIATARWYQPIQGYPWRRSACLLVAGISLWLFVSMEIRHLWQQALALNLPTSNNELYTYSAVWLLMAAVGMVVAIQHNRGGLYRGAMSLLLLVIAKIFLIDLAGLEGLLRVASFMGLGLVLLALAWLHQRAGVRAPKPDKGRSAQG